MLSLLTHYAHSDVRNLDHPHIVSTVSDAQNYLSGVLLHALGDHCFLGWGDPAADDSRGLCSHSIEEIWDLVKRNCQR